MSRGRVGVQRLTRAGEVSSPEIVRAVRAAAGDRPIRSITIALIGDAGMSRLHDEFLGDPSTTDVLTFDLRDGDGVELEGEIAVCVDVARRQARAWRVGVKEELLRYAIHGVLHLLGYDDDTPARRRRMRCAEDRVLAMLADEVSSS